MGKNDGRWRSGRKPLKEISNGRLKPSKSVKKMELKKDENGDLDRLLLVHSDISALLHQIDELVIKAINVKETSKEGNKEIESFSNVLSEILSSLKPWVPKFQKVLSFPTIEAEFQLKPPTVSKDVNITSEDDEHTIDSPLPDLRQSLVSPSPLVSWRAADCTVERGKQLFLLTPIPRSISRTRALSKSVALETFLPNTSSGFSSLFGEPVNPNKDISESECEPPIKSNMKKISEVGCDSPLELRKSNFSMIVMTPSLKVSPPKTCKLLEPNSNFSHRKTRKICKSTPFPVRAQSINESPDSEPSNGEKEVPETQSMKYPELVGIKPICMLRNGRKPLEASPAWFMSPPKTCILMEPPEEKPVKNATTRCDLQELANAFNQQISLVVPKEDNMLGNGQKMWPPRGKSVQVDDPQTKTIFNPEKFNGKNELVDSTPLWKEPKSTIRTGKRPGENTLKKELWTKFEAASTTTGFHLNLSEFPGTSGKGFLDRLEEASSDEGTDCLR